MDTKAKRSPLMFAAQAGHEAAVELLLQYGAFVDAFRTGAALVAPYAATTGTSTPRAALIDADADINGEKLLVRRR